MIYFRLDEHLPNIFFDDYYCHVYILVRLRFQLQIDLHIYILYSENKQIFLSSIRPERDAHAR